jgi:WD domain, G-beta repeat
MYWFAINREDITPIHLHPKILLQLPLRELLETLEILQARSLIETTEVGLSQQPVIMEYITEHLIEKLEQEIIQGQLYLFKTHALLEVQSQDYLREGQIQLILHPLAERLLTHFGSKSNLEDHLRSMLEGLRRTPSAQTGYAGGNILNLFCQLKTDLTGFDFSHLAIRQAHLLNAVLHDVDFTGTQISQTVFAETFTGTQISQTVFAETFGGIVSVAFSPDGRRFATSDIKGDIQIWDAQAKTLLVRCRGHQIWTWAVAFSPDGLYLASGSDDRQVKLWDVETGQCL